jgi:N-acetylneuraminic acid mutarotase
MKNVIAVCVVLAAVASTTAGGELVAELIEPMAVAHVGAGVVSEGGRIYVWSGYTNSGGYHGRTAAMEIYDPATGHWTRGADVPGARNNMGPLAVGGRIYSVGGERSPSGSFTSTVYRYDVASDAWESMNGFPTSLWQSRAANCGGTAYMVGGRHGYGRTYPHLYAYDEGNDAWVPKADMLLGVIQAGVASSGGKIWVFGGEQKDCEACYNRVKKIQVYDPATNTWSYHPQDMPVRLYLTLAAVWGDSVWMFSGKYFEEGTGNLVDNELAYEFRPDTGEWRTHTFIPPAGTEFHNPLAIEDGYVYFTEVDPGGARLTTAFRVLVPEPGTLALLMVGGLALIRRRRE